MQGLRLCINMVEYIWIRMLWFINLLMTCWIISVYWGLRKNYIATSFMACVPKHELIKEFIDKYENVSFYNDDKSLDLTTNVQRLTQILEDRGLVRNNKLQKVGDISIYPQEYFSPYDYGNCIRKILKILIVSIYF